MFELLIEPAPAALAPLGEVVELRELSYGEMRAAMRSAPDPAEVGEAVLAAALFVDGEPLGTLDALHNVPGRFSGGIAQALQRVLAMHGLRSSAPDEDTPPDPAANDPDPDPGEA